MRLTVGECRARLETSSHGVLSTVHAERGVDAVPVIFVLDADHVGIPVDLVKPKSSTRLQRERNLCSDPRATLLIEHWDPEDWSQLWWVRAHLRSEDGHAARQAEFAARLAARHWQYREQPFARILLLRVISVTGWSAADPGVSGPGQSSSSSSST